MIFPLAISIPKQYQVLTEKRAVQHSWDVIGVSIVPSKAIGQTRVQAIKIARFWASFQRTFYSELLLEKTIARKWKFFDKTQNCFLTFQEFEAGIYRLTRVALQSRQLHSKGRVIFNKLWASGRKPLILASKDQTIEFVVAGVEFTVKPTQFIQLSGIFLAQKEGDARLQNLALVTFEDFIKSISLGESFLKSSSLLSPQDLLMKLIADTALVES